MDLAGELAETVVHHALASRRAGILDRAARNRRRGASLLGDGVEERLQLVVIPGLVDRQDRCRRLRTRTRRGEGVGGNAVEERLQFV